MVINSYRDLMVWQKAMDLVMLCYEVCKLFPDHEKFGLSSQLQRAAVSVPSNIIEGYGRKYTSEYLRCLSMAYASLMELETQIQIVRRLGYITKENETSVLMQTAEISRMLSGLRRSLKSSDINEPETSYTLAPIS